jgi:hypothetical protein
MRKFFIFNTENLIWFVASVDSIETVHSNPNPAAECQPAPVSPTSFSLKNEYKIQHGLNVKSTEYETRVVEQNVANDTTFYWHSLYTGGILQRTSPPIPTPEYIPFQLRPE